MNRRAFLKAGAGAPFFAGYGAWAAGKSKPELVLPKPKELLASLRRTHPRLLVPEGRFTRLRTRIGLDPRLQGWAETLRKQAAEIIAAPPSRHEIPDGLRLLATSRRVLNRIYTLAFLYRLDGETRFAERAWEELAAAANFPDWNPRHFLDTAEMTHAFAIAYDWLHDFWTPDRRALIQRAMVERGFNAALPLYRNKRGWTRARHNWNQVCNGGMAIGALALADVEPEIAAEILRHALESITIAMAEFAPDGAWQEGPGYWNYATTYNVALLAALESALGTDFGLSQVEGFDNTGLFPIYLTGPLGRTFNYADGGDHTIRAPQLFWLARKFNQPVFAWYQNQVAAPTPLDLVWHQPPDVGPRIAGLARDKFFHGAEIVTFRSEWENPKALFAGFKAGDNKANHGHLDLGSFVFDALGVRWAVDLGADDYNLPGYFGNQRWNYYRLRAEGQNTLVLNPSSAPDQEPSAATRILHFASSEERAVAVADLTPAYQKHARKVWRGVALLDRKQLLVQDEIEADVAANAWWFMHTPAVLSIHDDGRSASLQQVGAKLRAEILSPERARFRIMDAQPLPQSPHPEKQAANEGIKKLAIHLENTKHTRIAVLLTPEPAPESAATPLTPLAQWMR